MNAICKRAGVARSTPTRWRSGFSSPTMRKLDAMTDALAALIAEKRAAKRGKKAA